MPLNDKKQPSVLEDKGEKPSLGTTAGAWAQVPESVRTAGTIMEKITNDGYVIINLDNFDKFQGTVFHLINRLIQDPKYVNNKFTSTWKAAMYHLQYPIQADTSFRTVQKVFKVGDLQEYQRFLMNCPHLDFYIDIQETKYKNKNALQFKLINQDKLPGVAPAKATAGGNVEKWQRELIINEDGYVESCGTSTDFLVLMTQVWAIMTTYIKEDPSNNYSKTWKKWIESGLTLTTNFQEMKSITNFEGLYDFYYFLKDCPAIVNAYDIKWDNKILYRHKMLQDQDLIIEQQIPHSNKTPSESSETTLDDKDLLQLTEVHIPKNIDNPTVTVTPVTPAKHTNVDKDIKLGEGDLDLPEINEVIQPEVNEAIQPNDWDIMDNVELEYYSIDTTTLESSLEFTVFNCYILDIINKWRDTMAISKETKAKWSKWLYLGFHKDKGFKEIKKILGIQRLPEYLEIIKECPLIEQHVAWEWRCETLKYWFIKDFVTKENTQDKTPNKLISMRSELQLFSHRFDITLKDANNKIRDQLYRLDILDERTRKYARNLEHNLYTQGQRILNDHKATLSKLSETLIAEHREQLAAINLDHVEKFRLNTSSLINGMESDFDTTVATMVTELNAAAEKSLVTFKEAIATTMKENDIKAKTKDDNEYAAQPQKEPPRSKLFPNVDPALYSTFKPSNPYLDAPAQGNPTQPSIGNMDIRDPTLSPVRQGQQTNIPDTTQYDAAHRNYMDPRIHLDESGLPSLQYDNIMKRANVQYTGEHDILVFYNQLMNGVAHYGLYLCPVTEFALGKSLCPTEYRGVPINDARYKLMASCLYQKLATFDTIPAEFTQARTTINTYATANDGYKVLYAMIEPMLYQEKVTTAPLESQWRDIHEYALKLQSYLNCENLAGRSYTPKEQTDLFLTGLSSTYNKAIRRARTLLDTVNPADPTVPAVLKLTKIPATIDRWMKEENGQSICRAAYSTPRQIQDTRGRSSKEKHGYSEFPDDKHRYSDKSCGICGIAGHPKAQCTIFAKYLICREADQKADDKLRSKVLDFFRAETKRKSERGRKRAQLGTVRQLWEEGKSYEELEQKLLESLPELTEQTYSSSDSEDDE